MSVPGRRTVSRQGYNEYIQSDAWRMIRERYWCSKLPKWCYCCGADWTPGMHLHHRTYKNLGNERLMDLVPVCRDCHDEVHRLHREPKWKNRGLWATTNYVRNKRGGRTRAAREVAEIYQAKGLQQKKKRTPEQKAISKAKAQARRARRVAP